MRHNGWKRQPIDVVRMPDGSLTSIDNQRLYAARHARRDVQARIRSDDDVLGRREAERFEDRETGRVPRTWGEAIEMRVARQPNDFVKSGRFGSHRLLRLKDNR